MMHVPITHSAVGRTCMLREVSGRDEVLVSGTDTGTALVFLEALVFDPGSGAAPGMLQAHEVPELSAPDRDRLLAAVYRSTYGSRIETSLPCRACGELFDLNFELDDLLRAFESAISEGVDRIENGVLTLPSGARMRLPTGRDECAVAGHTAEEAARILIERCRVGDGDDGRGALQVDTSLEHDAPILDLELDAQCPECGEIQAPSFDIQGYLLESIRIERRVLVREIHRLASAYGWSRGEILSLPRSQRKQHVELIDADPRFAARRSR